VKYQASVVKAPPQDAIAIIGIGCRFPGASGVEAFWRVLHDGLETTGDYPGGRLPFIDGAYATGTNIATRRGGFLRDLDRFDAEFFGVSPREAALLDPQQRLLLEVAWEAIEDAGIPAPKIAGTPTGVFVGLWTTDYESCLYDLPGETEFYSTTGSGRYPASGRLAYFFDLRGPNLTLDTACSSSLVAIHLACQSLRQGESEMALAGGANVILRPEITVAYTKAKMLSPDGRSKFGDAAANGYVRSEGAGMLLLKPLARAVADGDPIYALIRGTSVNNDGRSSGLLVAPSRDGQEALLRTAFRGANVDAGAIDYIEAHGTGTPVGDPVEVETIGRVVDAPERKRPCLIGSVKTNIGHTEAAAGVAGVIKVALALQRGTIPGSLHLTEPNPAIDWNRFPVAVQTATGPWPHMDAVRLAGVSGFGITGTNAHVVMENFEAAGAQPSEGLKNHIFVLSANSNKALETTAESWLQRLQSEPAWPQSLAALAYTAGVRRAHHDFRFTTVAGSRAELYDKLTQWLTGQQAERTQAGRRLLSQAPKIVFVFPGQGAQWPGMARGLFHEPVFQEALAECDESIRGFTRWSVIDRLLAPEMPEDAGIAQPCLFAVMVSLAALWRSWGIEPQAVVGHSMGECAAAVVSGALSIEDAAAVVSYRSQLMKRASGKGSMAFAALSMDHAEAMLADYAGRVSISADNGPESIVLSGDTHAIEDVMRRLTEREIFCRRVKVDVASHSSHMDPLRAELEKLLRHIRPRQGSIPLYSTTTGCKEDGAALNAGYWSRNLRQPVLFSSAVRSLLNDGFDTLIEISSHPLLLQSIGENIGRSGKQAVAVGSLRRDADDAAEMLNSLGTLYVCGVPVDFRKLYPEGICLRLPAYPWQRERHWIETDGTPRQLRQISAHPASASDCANDTYELRWFEEEAPPASVPGGVWILLSDGDEVAAALAPQLQTSGNVCICVSNRDELRRALEATGGRCRGIIRIPGTRSADPNEASQEALEVVRTVRAAAAALNPPRLWFVTTGVWRLPGDAGDVCAAQSPAWGLGSVIEREHPELRCVNVDLSASPGRKEIESLARLICQDGPEEQLAVRGGRYFVARYERVTDEKNGAPPAFRANAAYLIIGGLGGIGLHVARWLVQSGARHLAIAGRRPPDDTAREQIAALESLGAVVRVFSADIADDKQATAMLDQIRAELPPLAGVFHLAAVIERVLLNDLEAESLGRVMRSKAVSAWSLDRHLKDVDLDFFVLFSSIASAISQPGLGSYAAANAYLEALARYRRARGLNAQCVQWGLWLETGLSNDERARNGVRAYRKIGIQPLAVEGALRALGQIMASERTGVLASPVSWGQFADSFENAAPPRVFQRLLPKDESVRPPAEAEPIGRTLREIEPDRRRAALEAHLREKLAAVLKTGAERIDPAKPFRTMGVDSLMALEFVRRLSVTTSRRLPVTTVFNYPTVQTLAGEIARRMAIPLDCDAPAMPMRTAPEVTTISTVAGLTDEEVIEALVGKGGQGQ
jgi:acyl transferase domain-containing protein